jgi:outer membrane protein
MKTGTLTISFLIYLFLSMNLYAQQDSKETLTLTNAINLAIHNQPLIEQAMDQVDAAEAKIMQQKSSFYPRVQGDLSYTRLGPVTEIAVAGHSFQLYPADNYDAKIVASELVYDFGKRRAILDLMKTYKLTALDKIDLIRHNLAFQAIRTYYTILFLEKTIKVNDERINTLQKHLAVTQKKVESGSATDFDILTTQVKVAEAQNQRTDTENILNKQRLTLNSLTGRPSDAPLILSGEFTVDSSDINIESLINEAYSSRPEIKLAKDAANNASLSEKAAALTDRPDLSVMASAGFKNGYQPDLNEPIGNWTAGIHASIPIFNGHLKNAKVAEARAKMKSSSDELKELKRQIKLEVEQAAEDLQANKAKIKTSKVQVEHAKKAVSRADSQYKDGIITNLDLIDTETALAQAKLMYLRIIYENVLNQYNLKRTTGALLR